MTKKVLITSAREYDVNGDYSFYLVYQALELITNIALDLNIHADVDVIKYSEEKMKLSLKWPKEDFYKIKHLFILEYGKGFIWRDIWL